MRTLCARSGEPQLAFERVCLTLFNLCPALAFSASNGPKPIAEKSMAEDKPTRWQSTTITRRAFLRSSTVAVGTLAAVTACGGGGGSSAPVGGAPSPAPGPAPSPAPSPGPPSARHQDQHQHQHRHPTPPSLIQRLLTLRKIQFRKVGDGSTTAYALDQGANGVNGTGVWHQWSR